MKLLVLLLSLFLNNFTNSAPEDNMEVDEKESIVFFGTVIEELTGDPLVGATVYIKQYDREIYTDFEGNFTIENIAPGQYDIEISYVSFNKKELEDVHISSTDNYVVVSLE